MIKISKELVKKINVMVELRDYLSIVVDYKKEAELSDLLIELNTKLYSLSNDFTNKDINCLINCLASENEQDFYLYDSDLIIETLFPAGSKKNSIIQSAYYWMDSKERIRWIVNNVLCDNKYYNIIDNVNNNYILSSKKLTNII